MFEPTFCEMYAQLCARLAEKLPSFEAEDEENEGKRITFKRVLLNKCQDEFQRGEQEQEAAEKAGDEENAKEDSDESKLSKEVRSSMHSCKCGC